MSAGFSSVDRDDVDADEDDDRQGRGPDDSHWLLVTLTGAHYDISPLSQPTAVVADIASLPAAGTHADPRQTDLTDGIHVVRPDGSDLIELVSCQNLMLLGEQDLIFAGGAGDLIVGGAADGHLMAAAGGNATLVEGATGAHVLWGGGHDTIGLSGGNSMVTGGIAGPTGPETIEVEPGAEMFTFLSGLPGGAMVIDYVDRLIDNARPFGERGNSASVTSAGGAMLITLSDNTRIVLIAGAPVPGEGLF